MASLRGRNEEADTVKLGNSSFVSNVMGHVRFGFAAGCEAVAMPRRQQPEYSWGYAPGSG